jgi:O-antigen/teichoic acid export membrane protein
MAALAVASYPFFTLLLSERWAPTAPLFAAFAIGGMLQVVTMLSGPFLQAVGRTGARLRITVEFAVLWAITALVLVQFGAVAVAWGYSILTILYLPRMLLQYLRPIDCTLGEYLKTLATPTAVALGVGVVHLSLQALFDLDPWWEVAIALIETLLAWGVFLIIARRAVARRIDVVSDILKG